MDLNELMEQAEQLPDGLQKVSILENIIRYLESTGDTRGAFDQRLRLIESAMWAGLHERSLVAFVACLNQFDQSLELQENYIQFFWAYTCVVWFTVDQPAISLERIDQMFADLHARFEAFQLNLRPVEHLRWRVDMATGELERAQRLCESWRQGKSSTLCLDRVYQLYSMVELYFRCSRFQDTIEAARLVFEHDVSNGPASGWTKCHVMIAHVALGEAEQADVAADQLQLFLKRRHSLRHLYEVAFLLVYLVHRREMSEARKLFRRYIKWAGETTDKDNICLFMNAAAGMFRVYLETNHSMNLTLPASLPFFREDGRYKLADLATNVESWIDGICLTFDQRNQNSVYSDRIKFFRGLCLNGTPRLSQ